MSDDVESARCEGHEHTTSANEMKLEGLKPVFPAESGEKVAERMGSNLVGAITVLMVGLADSLGIFKHMAGQAPQTAATVAAAAGLHERWVRELLHQLASARLVSTDEDGEAFWLSEGQEDVLAHEYGASASPLYLNGSAQLLVEGFQKYGRLQEVFRSSDGRGMTYDEYGEPLACAICRDQGVWARHNLIKNIETIPGAPEPALIADLRERLERGATCADLGCGEGEVLAILAAAYPASTFHGYDTSANALAAAAPRLEALPNTAIYNPALPGQAMPPKAYDFIITYDAIHDMARPDEVLPIARAALKDDAWGYLIADFKAQEKATDVMRDDETLAAFGYGVSVMLCLNSGMSAAGGLGLGTLGWHEKLARAMLQDAGFAGVDILDWENDFNRFYHAKL